jgi:Zn-dependent alcohol dehydrogenase
MDPIPDTMRAVVWRGSADPSMMQIELLKTPKPKANEVLVKVKACGVCHTDLHCIKGEVPFPQPAVFGHEICGEVVQYGPLESESVEDGQSPKRMKKAQSCHPLPVGTKVMCPFIMPCSRCAFCKKGEEDTCETFFALNRLKGHLYDDTTRLFTSADHEEVAMYSFAGLAEYAVVPKTAVFAIPDALLRAGLYQESCVLGCAFFTAYGAIRNAAGIDPRPGCNASGKSVCVIGCGGVGGSLLQICKYLGLSPIIAVDVTDEALEQAKALGADFVIKSSAECDAVSQITQITDGRKVDYCFEVCAYNLAAHRAQPLRTQLPCAVARALATFTCMLTRRC